MLKTVYLIAATLMILLPTVPAQAQFNLIMVIKPVDTKKGAVEGFVDDTVIDQKINALLLDGSGVNVTNFRWRSVQGHVFLFGRALSASEKTKATGIVKGIKNVLSVTDRVKVRPKG